MSVVDKLLGKLENKLTNTVNNLNDKVANEGPMTWESDIISKFLPLNLTMTAAPEFSNKDGLINLHLDGRFLDVIEQATVVP